MERRAPAVLAIVAASLCAVGCGSTDSHPSVAAAGMGGAAAVVAAAGMGGAAGASGEMGGNAGAAGEPVPPLDGRWAMFTFEDPVAVELTHRDGLLSGLGCYAGLPSSINADVRDTCQPLGGNAVGRHVQFAFLAGPRYASDVHVSRDGQRMAGDFSTGGSYASSFTWLRIGPDDVWLQQSREPSAVGSVLEARRGDYLLEGLVDDQGEAGRLSVYGSFRTIASTLGAFWETEMTWNEAEQTLVAGPVPETAPDLAIQLTLRFNEVWLVSVDAVFPSGQVRTFLALEAL